jgi:hypothetical protein
MILTLDSGTVTCQAAAVLHKGLHTARAGTMLSEKAKGKQRELDPLLGQSSSSTPPDDSRDLTIRFTEGIPDFNLTVHTKDTVRDVKANVRG